MKAVVSEIKKQILTLMTVALGFVAAFVWKDAITEWLKPLYEDSSGPIGLTIAAVVVTVVVVIVTMIISKLFAEEKKEE